MKNVRVARRYATALMSAATELQSLEAVATDLDLVDRSIAASRELRLLMSSPVVSAGKKQAVFRDLYARRISTTTMQFLILMVSKHREPVIEDMIAEFRGMRDERSGIVNVQVTSAVELDPPQQKKLVERLEHVTGKKVRLRLQRDEDIKGGLLVRIGDTVMDSSVRRQLEILRERFVHGGGDSQQTT
ncbi:MAG: ATP synthase F1 subunit delta [Ignavibacteria bacterium]|nr:ATP synthase F1 subunit delta [Ignavibacteria bacterium]